MRWAPLFTACKECLPAKSPDTDQQSTWVWGRWWQPCPDAEVKCLCPPEAMTGDRQSPYSHGRGHVSVPDPGTVICPGPEGGEPPEAFPGQTGKVGPQGPGLRPLGRGWQNVPGLQTRWPEHVWTPGGLQRQGRRLRGSILRVATGRFEVSWSLNSQISKQLSHCHYKSIKNTSVA